MICHPYQTYVLYLQLYRMYVLLSSIKIPATDLFLMAGTSYYFVIIVTFNNPYAIRIKIYFCGIPVNKKNNNKYQQ